MSTRPHSTQISDITVAARLAILNNCHSDGCGTPRHKGNDRNGCGHCRGGGGSGRSCKTLLLLRGNHMLRSMDIVEELVDKYVIGLRFRCRLFTLKAGQFPRLAHVFDQEFEPIGRHAQLILLEIGSNGIKDRSFDIAGSLWLKCSQELMCALPPHHSKMFNMSR